MLEAARQVSEWTDGAFDVTFGALADVWKFDHDQDDRVPTAGEIAARLPLVDYRRVHVDAGPGHGVHRRAGMRVHLGGIGKGYAVDRAVGDPARAPGCATSWCRPAATSTSPAATTTCRGGSASRIRAARPRPRFATLELADATFSTSGDYERFFEKDGDRYHHILDPSVGQPARGCRSVTIVARQATVADGLSTGVFILGPERGMALVERLPDVEAVIVTADNRVLVSSGLASDS